MGSQEDNFGWDDADQVIPHGDFLLPDSSPITTNDKDELPVGLEDLPTGK